MRFLLDVNVGSRIAAALTERGHDVVRAALTHPTAEDSEILSVAATERRILITYDRDFGELIFLRGGPHPEAIIYLRFRASQVAEAIERLIPVLNFAYLEKKLTVLDLARIRQTPFPFESTDHD